MVELDKEKVLKILLTAIKQSDVQYLMILLRGFFREDKVFFKEGKNWPELDIIIKSIATDPEWAFYYAKNVIQGRWPEAEAVIATDSRWACNYAKRILKDRFIIAEPLIFQDPIWSAFYNHYIMKTDSGS